MKKSLFVLGVAVAALASCTNEEVVNIAESNVIKFDNAFVGKNTKAVTTVDGTSFNSFFVYAKKGSDDLFTNENVYKESNAWGYDNLKKWEASQIWKFVAYSNGGTTGKGSGKIETGVSLDETSGTALKITDYSVGEDNLDLVASVSTTDLASANTPIEFTFKHVLSKLKFTIESELGDDNTLTITNFSVTGAKDNATLTFTGAAENGTTWTTPSTSRTISNAAFGEATTSVPATDEFVVIPQATESGITVTFNVAATIGAESYNKKMTATIAKENADWDPNYSYNYIAIIKPTDLDEDFIDFANPVVEKWEDYTDINGGDLSSEDVQ